MLRLKIIGRYQAPETVSVPDPQGGMPTTTTEIRNYLLVQSVDTNGEPLIGANAGWVGIGGMSLPPGSLALRMAAFPDEATFANDTVIEFGA